MNFDMHTTFPRKAAIIGAARSGLAAARYLYSRGVALLVSDICDTERLEAALREAELDAVEYEGGGHSARVLESELIVLSPGVRSDLPVLNEARNRGIPVWSEIELGYRATRASFLAVTGSTGKSTTVSLLGEALKAGGKQTVVAGNIGLPLISVVSELDDHAVVALEISSFQLETVDSFRPRAAAVLNFMKNHLDRYAREQDYYDAKKRIAAKFTKDNHLVLNANDPLLMNWASEMASRAHLVYFGSDLQGRDCFWIEGGAMRYRFDGTSGVVLQVGDMKIGGRHNHENACVAAALAMTAGIEDVESIARGICSFPGLPHRLEHVAQIAGVTYYNDSKSTTAESICCAVEAFGRGVHLIAGGKDKGCDFSVVAGAISRRVKDITLIGQAADRMQGQWQGLCPIHRAATLNEAVATAAAKAAPGDVVVFSPGCSSFDMFANFEQRGDVFKDLVRSLGGDTRGSAL